MDKVRKVQYSLKQNCKLRIKGIFEDLQRAHKGVGSFMLITDASSLRILSSFMKMMELMELNILAVERIDNERNQYPKQHAIYFLSCQDESITQLLADFKDKKTAKYGKIHLFFLNRVSADTMRRLSQNDILLERCLTFKEFNQDFACKFDNIFSLETSGELKILYQSKIAEFKNKAQEIGDKLSTVILSFEKVNSIEIMFNKSDNNVSQQIAESTQLRINEMLQKLKADSSEQLDKNAGKITLLILDRAYDPLSPLIRDFYYQPMLYDLMQNKIENDIVSYQIQDDKSNQIIEKKAQLSEQDDLFKRYRFMHIGEVMSGISEEFNKFINTNSTAKMQMGNVEELDFKKMSEIVRSMPQYQELLGKYNMHMKLIEDCWSLFERKDLKSVGELEQSLATGLELSGDKIKEKLLISQISSRLQSDTLDEYDKLRLVLIATLTIELTDKHRKDLIQYLTEDKQKVLQSLVYLGINPNKAGDKKSKSKKLLDKEGMKKTKHRMNQQTFDLCRTAPEVENIVETFIKDYKNFGGQFKLPANFKSFRINCEDAPKNNVKSIAQKNRLANILGGGGEDDEINNGVQKLIVFVAGGLAYTEIRSIRNLISSQDQDFLTIIGGTSFCTPNQYVNSLLQLETGLE